MENFIERFPHIAEEIFEQLDSKSLMTCREVSKSWQVFNIRTQSEQNCAFKIAESSFPFQ